MTNYFKSSLRNLWKNRGYSALNIAGLAVGVACASLIFLWVEDEVTFDHDIPNRNQIYSVMENEFHNNVAYTSGNLPGPMAAVLTEEVAGIKNASVISLFVMANRHIPRVICIIISNAMETSHTTASQTKNRTFMRVAMVILGIVTAIIGTLSDVRLSKSEEGLNIAGKTKIVATDFSFQVAGKVASTLWPF